MSEMIDVTEAARLLGWTAGYTRWKCARGELPGSRKEGGKWQVPVTAHEKLARPQQKLTESAELLDVPDGKRREALRRLGIIREFEKFAAANGAGRTDALARYSAQRGGVKVRSLQRWIARYRTEGLLGLVDGRGGGKFLEQTISPEAFELFKSMYLTQQRLSVPLCWRNIRFVNKNENKGWKIPSLQSMYNYVERLIPFGVRVLHREGLGAYEAKCSPYIETDPDSIEPGQVWVGDHAQLNCWIRNRGKWIRPWVTAWMDMRSRTIVGFHISASPNQTTILLAAKRAIERYGPPDSVKIDNGKDYDSELWTGTTKAKRRALRAGYLDEKIMAGIYAMMDIGVSFAIPYHPQSKPIERWFDTLDCQLVKTIPTYCGKDTSRRPEELRDLLQSKGGIESAYAMEGFARLISDYVETYNTSAHTGRGMNGKSPAEVMAGRQSRRVLRSGVIDLLLRVWSRELVVGKNGVRFKGMWYGQFNMDLAAYQGKKVRAAYDPDDLRTVYVYEAATLRLITLAEQSRLICYGSSVSEESLREAMRQKSRARKIARDFTDSQLAANMDLPALTIRAMQDARKQGPEVAKQAAGSLRPVKTPLDGQVAEHKKKEALKLVRKAAGAESVKQVLDIDLSVLKPKRQGRQLGIFDG